MTVEQTDSFGMYFCFWDCFFSQTQRAEPVVVVAGSGQVGNAAGVVQALREQSVMSTPILTAVWMVRRTIRRLRLLAG